MPVIIYCVLVFILYWYPFSIFLLPDWFDGWIEICFCSSPNAEMCPDCLLLVLVKMFVLKF